MRLLMLAPLAAALHITPAVVLVKRPDAVQALLPGADAYFAREVHLSQTDAHRLLTKATVEMKPWVLEAMAAGLASQYRELKPGDVPHGAAAIASRAGNLAEYIAAEVDKGVARALAAYRTFYRGAKT